MKVAFFNAAAAGSVSDPDQNLLIHICHIQSLPRIDETVMLAGATWLVMEVARLVGPGDDYEGRVWLRPRR